MFNFKRKTNQIVDAVKKSFEPTKDPQVLIAEIHNEFDTATDRLLKEAKEIISKVDMTAIEKGTRLSKLGFVSSQESRIATAEISQKQKNEELAKNIMYYKTWYPSYKFITEDEVVRVCKKYGLVFGPVNRYIGDVPTKNLLEMEAFKMREVDTRVETTENIYNIGGNEYSINSFMSMMSKNTMPQSGYTVSQRTTVSHYQAPFRICAPQKDFDMRWMEVVDGYRLDIKDPIVLQPVNGGYLVVTKWGLESGDESLVNEKNN